MGTKICHMKILDIVENVDTNVKCGFQNSNKSFSRSLLIVSLVGVSGWKCIQIAHFLLKKSDILRYGLMCGAKM